MSWGKKGILAVAVRTYINLWVPRSGKEPPTLWVPRTSRLPSDVTALAWNPSGTKLAFGNEDGDVWVGGSHFVFVCVCEIGLVRLVWKMLLS